MTDPTSFDLQAAMAPTSKVQIGAEATLSASQSVLSRVAALFTRLVSGEVSRGVFGTLFLKGVSAIVAFAMISLAARSMSAEDFGHLVMWLSVAQIACVIGLFGQETLVTRKLGEYSATDQSRYAKGVMLFSLAVATTLCLLSSLGIGFFALTVRGAGVPLSAALVFFTLTMAASMLGSQFTRFFVGILVSEVSRNLLWRSFIVVALVVSISLGRKITPSEFLLTAAIALSGVVLLQAIMSWQKLPLEISRQKANWKIRDWGLLSTRFLASSTLEATNQYFDVIVIYWLLDPVAAGGYYAASRLANLFAIVLDALFTYAARYVPPLYYAGRRDELNRQLVLMAEVVIICVAIGLAIFVGGAKPLLNIFGSAFIDQRTTLILLAIGTAIQALGGPTAVIMLTTGNETAYTWTMATNVALRLFGFCIFIPAFGSVGAAAAASMSLAITTLILNRLCRKRVGLDPSILALIPSLRPAPVMPNPTRRVTPPLEFFQNPDPLA